MQTICALLQTNNHASTSSLHIFYRLDAFLPSNQQRQSTEGNTFWSDIVANMVQVAFRHLRGIEQLTFDLDLLRVCS